MPRKCKVCMSQNRAEYENMYLLQNKTVEEIWRYAASKGDQLSYPSMTRHMKFHVRQVYEYQKKVDRERDRILQQYLMQDIEIAKKIKEHLEIIENNISMYRDKDLTLEEAKIVMEWINQARLSIEQLLKWKEKLLPREQSIDEIASKLMELVSDFPPEILDKFTERLNRLIKGDNN